MYVSGTLSYQKLRAIFENPPSIAKLVSKNELPKYLQASTEVSSDARAVHSYKMYRIVRLSGISSLTESAWNLASIHALFSAVYKAFEKHFDVVAPPNNVRIITPCGRLVATIEDNARPSCPAQTVSPPPNPNR
jgi:hypothetical protein